MSAIIKRAALTAALLQAFSLHAATTDDAAVIVTATRFSETTLRTPANISVITRDDIRRSPASSLPEVLKTYAGIDVVSLYGSVGIDAMVDVRGFGDAANSNTLILLDGERLNPIDSGNVGWSAIPLASIERIEIIRGAGTILYGDRASGGVINIVTDKSGRAGSSATASAGSHGQRGLDAVAKGGSDDGYFNLFAHYAADAGWRQNSRQEQQALSGHAGRYLPSGEAFLDYAVFKDRNGLPSDLPTAIYLADPRRSYTPDDNQQRDGYRLRPGIKLPLGTTLDMEAEFAHARENQHWNNASYGSTSERVKDTDALTPRLRWRHGLGQMASESVFGLDYYAGDVVANYSAPPNQAAHQTSRALYFQNTTALDPSWTATLGLRSQSMRQSAHQDGYTDGWGTSWLGMDGGATRRRDAFDVGATYTAPGWRTYAKTGTTYRFANTDELFGFNPVTWQSVFASDLRPQHGTIQEVGGSFDAGILRGQLAAYRMKITDEIGFDNSTFANVNLDPTQRQGIETELAWKVSRHVGVRATYTYSDAEFRGGSYAGKRIPLVARDRASLQVAWDGGTAGNYAAVVNGVGSRPYSGDSANATGMLAGYATLDFKAEWNLRPWVVTARVQNALDQRYAPWGAYVTYTPSWYPGPAGADHWYYPADGRSFNLSARYDFK